MSKKVIVRFAPSPTGFLHIGGARTALFNYLFAKHHNGQFLLRIEDTDRKRSSDEAVDKIFESLEWLGLKHDGDIVFQFARQERHVEVAKTLLEKGLAYYCYCTPEELTTMKEEARAQGKPPLYDRRWRDRDPSEAPEGINPVLRFKAPMDGETVINDHVQGEVKIQNNQLDDMILLRSDGTPTYMLSVVVDDHDMGITHIIRGDDHLTNAFRQYHIFKAMEWDVPEFAHIPLIHGADGAKLSKRHGAVGTESYRDEGYLSDAMVNYLLRLGWSHGDDEIISRTQAKEWFNLESIGRSAARFDDVKLKALNAHYIKTSDNNPLYDLMLPFMREDPSNQSKDWIIKGMNGLKERAKDLKELADSALFYIQVQPLTDKAKKFVTDESKAVVKKLIADFENLESFDHDSIESTMRAFAEREDLKLGKVAQPLRVALTGSTISPSLFEVMEVLGKEETLLRLKAF